jgi:hypothetical protein
MKPGIVSLFLVSLLLICGVSTTRAQGFGALKGTIKDLSGAMVPDASVT